MKYRYILLDDDTKSILKMRSVMDQFSNTICVGTATTYNEGLDLILEHQPELVFLEINPLSKESGLSLLLINELYRYLPIVPKIVAISQDQTLAYEAFKFEVFDFLIKPFDVSAIRKIILRLDKHSIFKELPKEEVKNQSQQIESKPNEIKGVDPIQSKSELQSEEGLARVYQELAEISALLRKVLENSTSFQPSENLSLQISEKIAGFIQDKIEIVPQPDWIEKWNANAFEKGTEPKFQEVKRNLICIKSYGDYRFLELDDIAFLKADNNSTDITMGSGDEITAFKTLKYFEENLPSNFFRIHNSYIVNQNYISRIHTGNTVCYIKNSKVQIPFSKSYKDNIDQILTHLAGIDFGSI
ncbi:LytR/AlgR family response regulator transcription factor [Flavobacterium sp.]|uniref:LytR/AlgR family response regulator transcription factor n=1 Tax=Flavobacterium sp. TaxID=239 RepID=UPI002FDA0984